MDVEDLGRRESVEESRGGVAVGADVFAINEIAQFQVRQSFRL